MPQKQHGGARPGAGRKPANPEGRTTSVAVSVPARLVDQLDGLASQRGWSRSEAVTDAIRRLLKSAKPQRKAGESNPTD